MPQSLKHEFSSWLSKIKLKGKVIIEVTQLTKGILGGVLAIVSRGETYGYKILSEFEAPDSAIFLKGRFISKKKRQTHHEGQ